VHGSRRRFAASLSEIFLDSREWVPVPCAIRLHPPIREPLRPNNRKAASHATRSPSLHLACVCPRMRRPPRPLSVALSHSPSLPAWLSQVDSRLPTCSSFVIQSSTSVCIGGLVLRPYYDNLRSPHRQDTLTYTCQTNRTLDPINISLFLRYRSRSKLFHPYVELVPVVGLFRVSVDKIRERHGILASIAPTRAGACSHPIPLTASSMENAWRTASHLYHCHSSEDRAPSCSNLHPPSLVAANRIVVDPTYSVPQRHVRAKFPSFY